MLIPPAQARAGLTMAIAFQCPGVSEPLQVQGVLVREGRYQGHYAWGVRFTHLMPYAVTLLRTIVRRQMAGSVSAPQLSHRAEALVTPPIREPREERRAVRPTAAMHPATPARPAHQDPLARTGPLQPDPMDASQHSASQYSASQYSASQYSASQTSASQYSASQQSARRSGQYASQGSGQYADPLGRTGPMPNNAQRRAVRPTEPMAPVHSTHQGAAYRPAESREAVAARFAAARGQEAGDQPAGDQGLSCQAASARGRGRQRRISDRPRTDPFADLPTHDVRDVDEAATGETDIPSGMDVESWEVDDPRVKKLYKQAIADVDGPGAKKKKKGWF
jgi:hypothetical protein